jgi:hypothetical protein
MHICCTLFSTNLPLPEAIVTSAMFVHFILEYLQGIVGSGSGLLLADPIGVWVFTVQDLARLSWNLSNPDRGPRFGPSSEPSRWNLFDDSEQRLVQDRTGQVRCTTTVHYEHYEYYEYYWTLRRLRTLHSSICYLVETTLHYITLHHGVRTHTHTHRNMGTENHTNKVKTCKRLRRPT